jgi:hypothetical protein
MYDYIIELKPPSYKPINIVSQVLLFLSLLALGYEIGYKIAFINLPDMEGVEIDKSGAVKKLIIYAIFACIIIAFLIIKLRQRGKGKEVNYKVGLIVAAVGWLFIPGAKYIFIVYAIASILEKPVKTNPEIAFDKSEIVLNSFPKKIFNRQDVNNVVLKDGLLTIDLKNNKLFQKPVVDNITPKDEQEFNDFCKTIFNA